MEGTTIGDEKKGAPKPPVGAELHDRRSWITLSLMVLVILASTAFRLHDLGARSLWLDEIFTATFVRADLSLVRVINHALSTPIPAPPLWFIITHGSVRALGSSEFALRLPAAVAGIMGVAVTYRLGRTLFGRTEGIVAALFLSFSPFHIYYSREARYYAALTLFSLLTLHLLQVAMHRHAWRWWVGFALMTVVNIYIHLMAFLVLLAEIIFVAVLWTWQRAAPGKDAVQVGASGGRERNWGQAGGRLSLIPMLFCLSFIALSYAPMWPYVMRGILGPRGLGNAGTTEQLELSMAFFISTFGFFGAGPGLAFALFTGAFVWGIAVSALARGRQILSVLLWIAVPFAVVLAVRPKHFFSAKYLIFILPVYLIGAALGVAEMGRSIGDLAVELRLHKTARFRKVAVACGTLVVVILFTLISSRAVGDVYTLIYDDWGSVGRFLRDNVSADDVVICLPAIFVTLPVEKVLAYYGPTPGQVEIMTTTWPGHLNEAYATYDRLWLVSTNYTWTNLSVDVTRWLQDKEYVELRFERGFRVLVMEAGVSEDTLLTEAMRFSISDASVWGSLAEALQARGWVGEAITAYQEASKMSPKDGTWRARLGRVYYEQGQYDLAVAEYREAIRLTPDIPGFHSDLAEVLRSSGDRDAALKAYRKALQLYLRQRRGTEDNIYVQTLRLVIAKLEDTEESIEHQTVP